MLTKMYKYIPFTNSRSYHKWLFNKYLKHSGNERNRIFLSIARFCHVNRPIKGYYFEFGCHSGTTMRMAYDNFRFLFDWTYVAFDSFEGLPEIKDIDRQQIWEKGKLKTAEDAFVKVVTNHGMPREKLITVKGFYDQSLTKELQNKLLPQKAAVIYVDCDLYHSTIPILKFIKPFLQKGTVLVFDDWNCFWGDPKLGERRAFKEFLDENPELEFEEFVSTNEGKSFIFVGEKNREVKVK